MGNGVLARPVGVLGPLEAVGSKINATYDFGSANVELILSPESAQFVIVSDTGQALLAPAESRTVEVAFDTSAPGTALALLTVTSDDTDEPVVDFLLTGRPVAPNNDAKHWDRYK